MGDSTPNHRLGHSSVAVRPHTRRSLHPLDEPSLVGGIGGGFYGVSWNRARSRELFTQSGSEVYGDTDQGRLHSPGQACRSPGEP